MTAHELTEAEVREVLLAQHIDMMGEGRMVETTEPQSAERHAVMKCDHALRDALREPSDDLLYAVRTIANVRLRQHAAELTKAIRGEE